MTGAQSSPQAGSKPAAQAPEEKQHSDAAEKPAAEEKTAAEEATADKKAAAEKEPAEKKSAAEQVTKPEPKPKGYVVTGAAVILRTDDGAERYLYRGAPIDAAAFSKDSIKHAVSVGLIEKAK